MDSISTEPSARSWPTGGPVTVVVVSVCSTAQPIGASTWQAKAASPCKLVRPRCGTVTVVPVSAAKASGYVALLASLSTSYVGGAVYVCCGMRYTYSPTRSTCTPNARMMATVMSIYGCEMTLPPTRASSTGAWAYGAQSRMEDTYCDDTLAASSIRPPRRPMPVPSTRSGRHAGLPW